MSAVNPTDPRKSEDQLLTAQDVARLLAVSVRTVWRLRDAGDLPAPVRVGKHLLRWRRSDIESHISQDLPIA